LVGTVGRKEAGTVGRNLPLPPSGTFPEEHRDDAGGDDIGRGGPETLPEQLSSLNSRDFFLLLLA